ncbi:MAG: hypothetical protein MZU79_06940 [Anaerotruncus sp.]|nr:hypothetical protein [Anaerotruncus sp.]
MSKSEEPRDHDDDRGILLCSLPLPAAGQAKPGSILTSPRKRSIISRSSVVVYSPRFPVAGQAVQFSDALRGTPVSWQWISAT